LSSDLTVQSDCLPCILTQILRVSRAATDNEWLHRRAIKAVLEELQDTDFSTSPAELLSQAVQTALKTLGSTDPMAGQRESLQLEIKPIVDHFRELIGAEASLTVALTAAAAANLIDQRALNSFDLLAIKKCYEAGFARGQNRLKRLIEVIEKSRQIVYLLDNAGEAEVDRLLVDQLVKRGKKVTLVVKSPGLLHDVTAQDVKTGHPIIETGSSLMGALPVLCSAEFSDKVASADLVIAKGSANYETLPPEGRPTAYLLATKCKVVARSLGIKKGQLAMIFADERQKV
jgi:damage-control phosphatase, subfamily I